MGYYYTQRDEQNFFVAAEKVPEMLQQLKKVLDPTIFYEEEGCGNWRYRYDEQHNITGMFMFDQHKGYNDDFLAALAPFVRDGDFVEIQGEDEGDLFRFVWKQGKMYRVTPTIVWEMDHLGDDPLDG